MMENYILKYYQSITNGSITVGKWVRLLYERIIKGLENKSFFYDQKRAAKAIDFIEMFCRHHEGSLGGQKIKLELWQKAFISVLFGIIDENGVQQWNESLLVMGRKNGKTLLASAVATYLAYCGDYGARVYMAAPKLDQARLCFDQCYQTIKKEPELEHLAKKRRTDIYIESSNSTIAPLAFSEKKSDGLNVSCAILDELASWRGEAGLKFYEVIKSSIGARKQPLLFGITTSGYEKDGIYDALIIRGTKFLMGDSREQHFLPVLYMIDEPDKWNDINELQKANPNLGVSITAKFLLDELAIAEDSLSHKGEFITKFACLKQNSSAAWLSTEDVTKCFSPPMTMADFEKCYCVGGFDLSMATDLTSAVLVTEIDGELFVLFHFWLPSERLNFAIERDGVPYDIYIERGWLTLSGENYIDYHSVYDWFVEAVRKYKLFPLVIGYDKYSARYLVQDLNGFGFKTDDVYQGFNLTNVIQETEGIIKDGRLKIGDNDLAKIHLLDTALESDRRQNKVRIKKVSATAHIDGVAALLCALTVRQKWFAQMGEQLKNKRRA